MERTWGEWQLSKAEGHGMKSISSPTTSFTGMGDPKGPFQLPSSTVPDPTPVNILAHDRGSKVGREQLMTCKSLYAQTRQRRK